MKPISQQIKEKPWKGWILFLATIVIVFFLGLLASQVVERRAEAVFAYAPEVEHGQYEPRNEIWGKNFPRQYQSYLKTSETDFASKYNGNTMIDMLEVDPRLVVLWAGYGFAKDYNQGRGHYYAIEDMRQTLRVGSPIKEGEKSPMPNTCWTCKSPDVPRLMNKLIEEKGDYTAGVAAFYAGSWDTKGHEVVNHIGCADCHDAETMNLRISRPALIEAFQRQDKEITEFSHQEMRSLVCAQCHVEYYFNKSKVPGSPYLTFPWDNGYSAEAMEKYYDDMEFSDWTHALSKAPMLKAQHPGYEVYLTGTHASRGVSCADCHMPFKSEGGQKFTDHHMQSPLNDISSSCQVCHREDTERLVEDVYSRQDRIIENRDKLEELIVRAHVEAKFAWDQGATEEQMKDILMDIRHAQWRWDYAAASHGGSFHSPVETGRVISTGITVAQEARLKLSRLLAKEFGFTDEVPYPDITTKAKAQEYIGLDEPAMKAKKKIFMEKVVPVWDEKAAKRESEYIVTMK
ncbi:MAG: ammonia-forming cytochrome c nitrite reductase [Marinilabiliales bacterium]|nr:MAG: ammonia-forming cytochrome c nitrite reductase [Marinilabiliales bacterium]